MGRTAFSPLNSCEFSYDLNARRSRIRKNSADGGAGDLFRLNSCEFSYDLNAKRSWIRKNSAGVGVDGLFPSELLRVQLRESRVPLGGKFRKMSRRIGGTLALARGSEMGLPRSEAGFVAGFARIQPVREHGDAPAEAGGGVDSSELLRVQLRLFCSAGGRKLFPAGLAATVPTRSSAFVAGFARIQPVREQETFFV